MSPENRDTDEVLTRIGFTSEEAEIYRLLLTLGRATVGKLSTFTRMSRTKIYSTLENLQAGGWIKMVSERPVTYAPVEPKGILEKKKASVLNYINSAMERLNSLYERSMFSFSETKTYRGLGVIKKTEEMISGASREILIVSAFLPEEAMGVVSGALEDAKKRGLDIRIVVSDELKGHPELRKLEKKFSVVNRVIPKAGMIIADDEVMFGAVEKEGRTGAGTGLFGIWTANSELVAFTRLIFEQFWE